MALVLVHDLPRQPGVAVARRAAVHAALAMLRTSATTSLTWLTQRDHLVPVVRVNVYRSIRLPSNAIYARSASPAPTICDHICARTRTRDPSCVLSAGKHLQDNTIANDTKAFTVERRSLYAEVNCKVAHPGDVADALHAQMHLVVISAAKQVGCASSHFSTKKLQTGTRP